MRQYLRNVLGFMLKVLFDWSRDNFFFVLFCMLISFIDLSIEKLVFGQIHCDSKHVRQHSRASA